MEKTFFEQVKEVQDIVDKANEQIPDAETPIPGYSLTLTPQQRAINFVYGLAKGERHVDVPFTVEDVKIVWFCKTLQNWKAMVAVLVENGGFYEVTYNGDKEETYVDYYKKQSNTVFKDADL